MTQLQFLHADVKVSFRKLPSLGGILLHRRGSIGSHWRCGLLFSSTAPENALLSRFSCEPLLKQTRLIKIRPSKSTDSSSSAKPNQRKSSESLADVVSAAVEAAAAAAEAYSLMKPIEEKIAEAKMKTEMKESGAPKVGKSVVSEAIEELKAMKKSTDLLATKTERPFKKSYAAVVAESFADTKQAALPAKAPPIFEHASDVPSVTDKLTENSDSTLPSNDPKVNVLSPNASSSNASPTPIVPESTVPLSTSLHPLDIVTIDDPSERHTACRPWKVPYHSDERLLTEREYNSYQKLAAILDIQPPHRLGITGPVVNVGRPWQLREQTEVAFFWCDVYLQKRTDNERMIERLLKQPRDVWPMAKLADMSCFAESRV